MEIVLTSEYYERNIVSVFYQTFSINLTVIKIIDISADYVPLYKLYILNSGKAAARVGSDGYNLTSELREMLD